MKAVRWIIVSLIAYLIGYEYFMWANHEFVGLYFLENVIAIVGCGFSSACLVLAGSYTAPSYRKIVSIVLTTIWCIANVFTTINLFNEYEFDWWVLFQNIFNVIGCIVGAVFVYEYTEEQDN